MVEIDKNVPIPERTRRPKYPWAQLEVGDSFVYEASRPSAQSSATRYRKETGYKFQIGEENGHCRIWRVA